MKIHSSLHKIHQDQNISCRPTLHSADTLFVTERRWFPGSTTGCRGLTFFTGIKDAIGTLRFVRAVSTAAIAASGVAIIALLTWVQDSVSAYFFGTVVLAAVAVCGIAIITFFRRCHNYSVPT